MVEKPYSSNEVVGGAERAGNRGYLYALGLRPKDLEKPFTAARFNERTEEQMHQNRPQTRHKKEDISR